LSICTFDWPAWLGEELRPEVGSQRSDRRQAIRKSDIGKSRVAVRLRRPTALAQKFNMFSFTHGFSRVIEMYGSIRKPFKRFPEFAFGATWLKPGVNEIKSKCE
jgi:hypothetical protein